MYKIRSMEPEELEEVILKLPEETRLSIQNRIDRLPVALLEDIINHKPLSRKAVIYYQLPFDRHSLRKLAVETIYHHLLMEQPIDQALFDTMLQTNEVDPFLYDLTIGMEENEKAYIEELSSRLRKDWNWNRLAVLEQAILLVALHEITQLNTPKAVAINEAVTIAKELCDEQSPKMINGILDQV